MLQFGRNLYRKYERWVPIAAFIAGFSFDALVLRRPDELKVILQQAIYLMISAFLIGVEILEAAREIHPPAILARIWKYREGVLHFLLGTLLNSYTIFYFKSSSAMTSFIFIAILVAVLILNEFKRFGKSQTQVHVAFLGLCLISYLVSLVPILMGHIGAAPFLVAVVISGSVFSLYARALKKKLGSAHTPLLYTHLLFPFAAIQVVFIALFFAHAIPPVPLSVSYMGIYHDVKKEPGKYLLTYTRSKWLFWQHGDQDFYARPGDSIYCFARVFSPTRFEDKLQIRWFYYDEKLGWSPSDAIPMPITGGREEGFRGFTKKSNFRPGDWRVQIETMDSREVGRINFSVIADESVDERASVSEEQ